MALLGNPAVLPRELEAQRAERRGDRLGRPGREDREVALAEPEGVGDRLQLGRRSSALLTGRSSSPFGRLSEQHARQTRASWRTRPSRSICERRDRRRRPGTTKPRTTPPSAAAFWKTLKDAVADDAPVRSWISTPKRRSGRSLP